MIGGNVMLVKYFICFEKHLEIIKGRFDYLGHSVSGAGKPKGFFPDDRPSLTTTFINWLVRGYLSLAMSLQVKTPLLDLCLCLSTPLNLKLKRKDFAIFWQLGGGGRSLCLLVFMCCFIGYPGGVLRMQYHSTLAVPDLFSCQVTKNLLGLGRPLDGMLRI